MPERRETDTRLHGLGTVSQDMQRRRAVETLAGPKPNAGLNLLGFHYRCQKEGEREASRGVQGMTMEPRHAAFFCVQYAGQSQICLLSQCQLLRHGAPGWYGAVGGTRRQVNHGARGIRRRAQLAGQDNGRPYRPGVCVFLPGGPMTQRATSPLASLWERDRERARQWCVRAVYYCARHECDLCVRVTESLAGSADVARRQKETRCQKQGSSHALETCPPPPP